VVIGVPEQQKATCVAVRPDGARLAIGTADGRVLIGDVDSGAVIGKLQRSDHVIRIAWAADSSRLLVADTSGRIAFYDGDGGSAQWELETGHGYLRDISLDPSGDRLATCGSDGMVRVWDGSSMKMLWENGQPERSYNAVGFSGDVVAIGSSSGAFVVFKGPGEHGALFNGSLFGWGVSALAINPHSKAAVFGGDRGGMQATSTDLEGMWPKLHSWRQTPPKPICVNTMQFSPDGKRFVAACSDGAALVFDWGEPPSQTGVELGKPFWLRRPKPSWTEAFIISGACFDPSGQIVYTCSFDGSVRRWDLRDERPLESTLLLTVAGEPPAGESDQEEGLHWRWGLVVGKPTEPLKLPRWKLSMPSLRPQVFPHCVEDERELPLALLVLGDFSGREDPEPLEQRTVHPVDQSNFDRVMQLLKPSVEVTVGDAAEPTELVFSALSDFDPLSIAAKLGQDGGQRKPEALRAVAALFGDDRFIRLERIWRGLWLMAGRGAEVGDVLIRMVNCSKEDLFIDFEDAPDLERSGLGRLMLAAEYGGWGGTPYAAVITDYTFEDSREDQAMLAACALVGNKALAPFFVQAGPKLLGLQSWTELIATRDLGEGALASALEQSANPFCFEVAPSFTELRSRSEAVFLGLCLPRVVVRPPIAFGQEGCLAPSHAGAAFAVGCQLIQSFGGHRTCSYFDDQPMRTAEALKQAAGYSVEVVVDDERARELSRLGFIPTAPADDGQVRIVSAVSCYRPPGLRQGGSSGMAHEVRRALGCTFIVSRLVQQLRLLALGSTQRDPQQLAALLDGWLQTLVEAMNKGFGGSEFDPPFVAKINQRPEEPRHPAQVSLSLPASYDAQRLVVGLETEFA